MLRPSPEFFLQDLETWRNSQDEYSSEQFYLNVQKYLPRLSELHKTTSAISHPFHGKSIIQPGQCRKAIVSLHETQILMQEFSISLNPSLQLVSFFAEPYCHLLLLLRIIEEEAANLIVPIQNYRINCTNVSSQYTLLQRKYIVSTFAKLHLSLDEVFVQITVL